MKKLILGGFIGILLILVWKSLQIYLPAFPAYDWAFQLSREHSSYQHFYHSVHTVIVPFLSILLLCSGVFLLLFRKKIQSVLWLILVIPVLIIAFLYTYLSSIGTSLPGISLLFSGYFYLLVLALSLALFLLILWGIGSKLEPLLIKKSERSKETAITALNQLFLGSGLMLMLGWVLGKIGIFNGLNVVLLLLLLSFIFWKNILEKFKIFFSYRISPNSCGEVIFYGLVLTLFCINISQVFFPFALGWDSGNHYLVSIKSLIEEGSLRGGIFPSLLEIFPSFFALFTGISGAQFFWVFLSSFLPIIIYQIWQEMTLSKSKNWGMFLGLLIFILPVIQFQVSQDVKLDVILLEIFILFIANVWQKNMRMAGLILGFLCMAKLTFVWVLPGFLFVFFLDGINNWKNLIKNTLIMGIFPMMIVLSHWCSWMNSDKYISHAPKTFIYESLQGPSLAPILNLSWDGFSPEVKWQEKSITAVVEKEKIPKTAVEKKADILKKSVESIIKEAPVVFDKSLINTGFKEEVSRYAGFETSFFSKILAIFTASEIPEKAKQYVDLGFLWVMFSVISLLGAFYLWGALFFIKLRAVVGIDDENLARFLRLSLIGIGSGIGWVFIGNGVAWYGLPLVFLVYFSVFYLLSSFFSASKEVSLWQKIFLNILVISGGLIIIFHLVFSRLAYTKKNSFRTSFSWLIMPNSANENRLVMSYFEAEKKAGMIINQNKTGNILRIGSMIRFFIDKGESRIIDDAQLDRFYKMTSKGYDGFIFQLRKNQIKFIVVDRGATSIEQDENGTLHKKFAVLQRFLKEAENKKEAQVLVMGSRIILVGIIPKK